MERRDFLKVGFGAAVAGLLGIPEVASAEDTKKVEVLNRAFDILADEDFGCPYNMKFFSIEKLFNLELTEDPSRNRELAEKTLLKHFDKAVPAVGEDRDGCIEGYCPECRKLFALYLARKQVDGG